MRCVKWTSVLMAIVVLAGCTQQLARESSADRAEQGIDYGKYVQGDVPWTNFTSLYSWDSNESGYVVLWTSPIRAYRLQLVGPCIGLSTAGAFIGLTSRDGMVSSNRDAVLADGSRCPIMRIQRLDAKAIRALREKPASSAAKQG